MSNMDKKNELNSCLKELNSCILETEKKYFHIRTVENLIYHYDDIKSEEDKQWVYDTLKRYFRDSMEASTLINRDISKSLYSAYIEKIASYYRRNLGFVILMNRGFVYFVYILVLAISYSLFKIYITVGFFIIFILNTYSVFLKYQKRKVYSIYW